MLYAVWCIYAVRSMEFPSFEIKTEADSNNITDCSQDDKPSTGMLGFDNLEIYQCVIYSIIKMNSAADPQDLIFLKITYAIPNVYFVVWLSEFKQNYKFWF